MPIGISASVGQFGANRSTDVKLVQGLLNLIPQHLGGPLVPLVMDGLAGQKTIGAITRFQQMSFGLADGRIDPNQKTLAKLNALVPGSAPPSKDPKSLAEQDKATSVLWAMQAGTMLTFYNVLDKAPTLETAFLTSIQYNYSRVIGALNASATVFRSRTSAEAKADKGVDKNGVPYPAYAFFNHSVNFTETFLKFGPLCLRWPRRRTTSMSTERPTPASHRSRPSITLPAMWPSPSTSSTGRMYATEPAAPTSNAGVSGPPVPASKWYDCPAAQQFPRRIGGHHHQETRSVSGLSSPRANEPDPWNWPPFCPRVGWQRTCMQ